MVSLLDDASQEGLVYLCVIMSVIALFLAIAIFYEMIIKNRKTKDEDNNNKKTLNIKEDSNITYEDLSKDEEVRRAKEELEKVKLELLQREQEDRQRKEKEERDKKETELNNSRIENNVNNKLVNDIENVQEENNMIDNKKVVKENIDKELLDRKIENIVNQKLESFRNELVEDNKTKTTTNNIEVENKTVDKKVENKNIDVSKYNKLLSKESKNEETIKVAEKEEGNTVANKEEINKEKINEVNDKETEISEQEEYERISEATKEKIIDDYLKKFYKESRYNDEGVVRLKDNSQTEKEERIKELQTNINNEFKDNSSLFEELEEENAIISYDELKKASNFGYTDEEMNKYEDEKDAIISIDELEKLYKEINNIKGDNRSTTSYKEDFVIPSYEYKTVKDLPEISSEKIFKKSDIISPIYGVRELDSKTKSDTLIKLNEEIKKTNEFLRMLKELKKNLE